MKTFKQFIEEKTTSRKYVAVVYDAETQQKLRGWCEENGFDLTKSYSGNDQAPEDFEFHTTVFYSENESNIENGIISIDGEVRATGFKLLGEDNDIPVLVITSPDLVALRKEFKSMGLKDKWPTYVPHISLSYVRKDYDLSGMKVPDFRMNFGELKIEDIDEDI
jgi:2'-5' RNA ligase